MSSRLGFKVRPYIGRADSLVNMGVSELLEIKLSLHEGRVEARICSWVHMPASYFLILIRCPEVVPCLFPIPSSAVL